MDGKVSLLRGFELVVDGARWTVPPAVQRVMAYLALQERPTPRRQVASKLWPDVEERRCSANLRSALWRIRRPDTELVVCCGGDLSISAEVSVDVRSMTVLANRLLDSADSCDDLALSHETLGGDLLPGWYEDWVLLERERIRQLRLHALDALAERLIALGRYGQAVQVSLKSVEEEPLRETPHRLLVHVHLAEGNVSEAVREYDRYRELLSDELGVEPSEMLCELVDGVARTGAPVPRRRRPRTAVGRGGRGV